MKKLAILLVAVMMVSMLSGCAGGANNSSTAAETSKAAEASKAAESSKTAEASKTEETEQSSAPAVTKTLTNWDGTTMDLPIVEPGSVSLSCMQGIRDVDATTITDDFWYVKKCEEDTGVHIVYQQVNTSDWDNTLNLTFASNDYPNIIMRSSGAVDSEVYGVDQGILVPVDDLLQYMPVYKARLDKESDSWRSIIRSDGKMYGIAKMSDDGTRIGGNCWFINQDWLDNLKLTAPTTTDELLDVMRAFIKEDANNNGDPNDEIGFCTTFDNMTTGTFNFWGIPENSNHIAIDTNKKVQFLPFAEDYRAGVEFLNTMYVEGLMDPASVTQDSNSVTSVLNQNNVGLVNYWRLLSAGVDPLQESMVWLKPIHAEGKKFLTSTSVGSASEGLFFTVSNPNLEVSAKWVDYLLCDQPTYETYYGPEGKIWSWNADHKCEVGPAGDQGVLQYSLGVNGIYYLPGWYYNETFVQPNYREERIAYDKFYKEQGYEEENPYGILSNRISMTPDEAAEKAQIFANLEAIYDEAVADMIMHGVTDDSWNRMIDNLKGAGADRFVELYQNCLDKYYGG